MGVQPMTSNMIQQPVDLEAYAAFVRAKAIVAKPAGFEVDRADINPTLKHHQREIVAWLARMGRAACFASFGLGKTVIQLETLRLVRAHAGGMALIVAPLGVRGEFMRDARMLGIDLKFARTLEACDDGEGIYITNYESVRDGKLDPRLFSVTSLDEAAVLRGFGGSKTFREFMRLFEGVRYKFIATATPSPNEYIELLAYSAYLEVMEVSQGKTRFFKRDSTKADKLTLHAHKAREFWLWVSSWAVFVQRPSDIGGDDTGYVLPELRVHWHEIPADHSNAGETDGGQGRLFAEQAIGIQAASREKRNSLPQRVEKARAIVRASDDPQCVIWCDLNAEQDAIGRMLHEEGVSASSLYGSQSIDEREALMDAWRARQTAAFVSKPQMYGSGVNLQQCHTMIFSGIGFKFADFIQGVHRIYRFLQDSACDLHLIYTENERKVRETLERKWAQHRDMAQQMTGIIREFGLDHLSRAESMARAMGVERDEIKTEHFHIVHNDTVLETAAMPSDSVGLILTSIPFSTQYEYSPNYADFGHSDDNEHFFRQMDFLTPNLLRVLKPGRMACIHVKDRIVPGGLTGLGFQTVYPFHARCIEHYTAHGFAYMGMKTIVTDVVRENNQTYRLGWTEQCKDATKMGVGMPEYLLLFRKPQSDTTRSYTDEPVTKDKPLVYLTDADADRPRGERQTGPFKGSDKRPCVRGTGYSRARWQIDAHGFASSSGDRFPTTDEIRQMPHEAIFKAWRKYSLGNVYEYEQHVGVGEDMEEDARLPVTFMLLQPPSWHPDVWTDIARMRCLNGEQQHKGKQMHLCPMQFDIADRGINQMSNKGDIVFDPFGGLMTVPYRAIRLGRFGMGVELNPSYFQDGAYYCEKAVLDQQQPTLFDFLDELDEPAEFGIEDVA
jgi:DNA modification methylase